MRDDDCEGAIYYDKKADFSVYRTFGFRRRPALIARVFNARHHYLMTRDTAMEDTWLQTQAERPTYGDFT